MGKTGLIVRLRKRKDFLLGFWATFLAALALASAILTIVDKHIPITLACVLIFLALSCALILNRHRLATKNLPRGLLLDNPDGKRLYCPCTLNLAEQVGRLAQDCYRGDNISPVKYESLRVKNPYILACLTGAQGEFLGYFDVIPLRDHFAVLFLAGKVTEKEMTHEDIYAANEITLCKYLYLSGLAVCNSETHAGHKNALILMWGLLKYLDHFYGKTNPLTFAVAVTDEGEELLQTFQLQVTSEASTRRDKHTMYALSLSRQELAKRLVCLPDYSSLCSLDWVSSQSVPRTHTRSSPPTTPVRHRIPLPSKNIRSLRSATSSAPR
jgi:hypothetical protein